MASILLTGPNGQNPLGFLAALGALRVIDQAGHHGTLHWTSDWHAKLNPGEPWSKEQLVEMVHEALHRNVGEGATETSRARKEWDRAKTAERHKREEIKRRRLHGKEAREAKATELNPMVTIAEEKRRIYLEHLKRSAPDQSLTLGKNLTATSAEFRDHCRASIEEAFPEQRRWSDLCAAFGLEDPDPQKERMMATPFALVSGSGHQDFLGTVQDLMIAIQPGHIKKALFGPWEPDDEKFSLRLDAQDDRRYALMDRDPTAHGNKPRTLWGANLLAFEALAYFPCMPDGRGIAVAGWRNTGEGWAWRWPLWEDPCTPEIVRCLLNHPDCWSDDPVARARLKAMGCTTVLTSRRIKVGSGANVKFNLTPGVPLW